jgi:hypothetical protein
MDAVLGAGPPRCTRDPGAPMSNETLPTARALPALGTTPMGVRGRRRPWLIATGALLASLGALVVVWLVGAAGQRQEVLVVRQAVPYGTVVTSQDLGIARVSLDPGVQAIPAVDRERVVGLVAVTQLVPGMLVAPGMVEPMGEPGVGRALVPIALPSDRMPAGGLRAGDRILAVATDGLTDAPGGPATDGPGWATTARSVPATVVRVGPVDINGVVVVDVTVSAADGPPLTVVAATGQVALVVQPMGR